MIKLLPLIKEAHYMESNKNWKDMEKFGKELERKAKKAGINIKVKTLYEPKVNVGSWVEVRGGQEQFDLKLYSDKDSLGRTLYSVDGKCHGKPFQMDDEKMDKVKKYVFDIIKDYEKNK
jgi:hypothetical protein